MKKVKLGLGDKIELRFQLTDGTYSSRPFTSNIQDILSEHEILVSPPDNHMNRWIEKIVQIIVARNDGAYIAPAQVIGKVYENNLFFLQLNIIADFVCIQRREFYRLNVILDVVIEGIGKAKTVDISGNGILIKTNLKLNSKQKVEGEIYLDDNKIVFEGVVVRSKSADVKSNDNEQNLVSINFVDIESNTQEAIIKFIYSRQLCMLKNGIPF